ncbi:SUMF1/EgtB/PvdO family nonheme iron enzyme, partial [bacterium]|nr:SUMF1/EgtB/PvdO family nonheme iron enzyme [bacterium]
MDSQLQHYRFQKVLTFAVILILILQGCNSDKGLTLNPTQNDPQLDDLIEFQMILVAGGSLILGDTWGDGLDIEKPAHLVKLDSFYIGNLEVSQFQYEALMGENPSTFVGNDLPVQSVSWFKAVDYCNKLSINDGFVPCYDLTQSPVTWDTLANGYRLPTEAEWEFAARGGDLSQVFKYAGSNTPTDVARFGYPPPAVCSTLKCGRLQPNELNLYDMSGNVWEW